MSGSPIIMTLAQDNLTKEDNRCTICRRDPLFSANVRTPMKMTGIAKNLVPPSVLDCRLNEAARLGIKELSDVVVTG